MKSLLVATDLSVRSDRAMVRAVGLARTHGASLSIVHVVDDALPSETAEAQATAARIAIHKHLKDLTDGERLDVSVHVAFGRAFSAILEAQEKSEAQLVVMGTHREDAFKDMFRGTTAERVIRAGNCPVLVAIDRGEQPYRRVVVGVDFSVYSRRAVEFAVDFAPTATFHLIHAYDVPFKGFLYGSKRDGETGTEAGFERVVEAEMARFLDSIDAGTAHFEQLIAEGQASRILHHEIDRLKPDLLVIGTHGRTGVAHAVLGSIAEEMLAVPPCDVLAVKAW